MKNMSVKLPSAITAEEDGAFSKKQNFSFPQWIYWLSCRLYNFK